MNSLKKKFGKFAVSTEKMAKINGGTGFTCVGANGRRKRAGSVQSADRFVQENGGACMANEPN